MKVYSGLLACLLFISSSAVLAVDFNLPSDQWRLISLPAAPPATENTVEKVFGDNVPGVYGTDWTLFEYNSGINKYRKLNKTDPVKQGVGYWVIQLSGNTVALNLPAGSQASAPAIALTSSKNKNPQWNLVGSPFSEPRSLGDFSIEVTNGDMCGNSGCSLDQAKDKQLAHNKVWSYNGQGYEEKGTGDRVHPWEGFWISTLAGSSGHDLSLVALPEAGNVLFRSGFETGVNLETPYHDGGGTWWQELSGADSTGFAWPMTVWGARGRMQMIVDSQLPLHEYLHNELEETIGHDGTTTRALHLTQYQKAEDWTQNLLMLETGGVETSDLYFSYWLRLPKDFATILGPDGWLAFSEWKTCCDDYRIAAYVYSDNDEQLYWHVHGDNVTNDPVRKEYWFTENKQVEVPLGEWFKVEIFLHRSNGQDGRFWWAINNEVIVDRKGPNRRTEAFNRWMPFNLYTNAQTADMWVDDIEVRDSFPPGRQ
jgi:hypothetical protein